MLCMQAQFISLFQLQYAIYNIQYIGKMFTNNILFLFFINQVSNHKHIMSNYDSATYSYLPEHYNLHYILLIILTILGCITVLHQQCSILFQTVCMFCWLY